MDITHQYFAIILLGLLKLYIPAKPIPTQISGLGFVFILNL